MEALSLQPYRALSIPRIQHRFNIMLTAIHFDDKVFTKADKIDYVLAYRLLAAEFQTLSLQFSKRSPE